MNFRIAFVVLALISLSHGRVDADIVITMEESGGDVVTSSAGGEFDLTGLNLDLSFGPFGSGNGNVQPSGGNAPLITVGVESAVTDFYSGFSSAPMSFGTGSFASADSGTGIQFGAIFDSYGGIHNLTLPNGYMTGDLLGAVSSTYSGETLATMGMTPGTYVWDWGSSDPNTSLTLNITGVPEPTSFAMFGVACAMMTLRRRRSHESRLRASSKF